MTRSRRLVEDFLVPSLNSNTYGELLKWVDAANSIFLIRWSHKNAAKWNLEDTQVFQDWDKLKGHYHPENKGYYMQAKQRFRAALYKLNSVKKIDCDDKHVKKYQLVLDNNKSSGARSKSRSNRSVEIPTRPSVICENKSFVRKQSYHPASPVYPPTPNSLSDDECQKSYLDYHQAEQEQKHECCQSSDEEHQDVYPQKSPMVLRENQSMHRTAHLPVPTAPVYSKVYYRSPNKGLMFKDSPSVLVTPTFNDSSENKDIQKEKLFFDQPYYPGDPVRVKSEGALNLSVKSEDISCR